MAVLYLREMVNEGAIIQVIVFVSMISTSFTGLFVADIPPIDPDLVIHNNFS